MNVIKMKGNTSCLQTGLFWHSEFDLALSVLKSLD